MVFEDFRGNQREVSWAEQRSLADRAANLLASRGVERGDRVAVCAPASPETAAMFLGTWKAGAILLSLSVLYGDEGIEHRIRDSQPKVIVTDAENADRMPGELVDEVIVLDADAARRAGRPLRDGRHLGRRPGPDLLHVRHHRASRRASSTPTATSSPTRSSSTATTCRRASSSTGWASGPGRRASAR